MPNSKLHEAALDYAARGWKIFPLSPKSKTPFIKDWSNAATSRQEQIDDWWTENPDYNIGLALGPSGLLAIDVDNHGDVDGISNWVELLSEHGFTETLISKSGAGGMHVLFRDDENKFGNWTGKLPDGIDVRGRRGLIVIPPSIHPNGKNYKWENDFEIAPMPNWLIETIGTREDYVEVPAEFEGPAQNLPKPDWDVPPLSRLGTSKLRGLILEGPGKMDRSGADFLVVKGLLLLGASHDEIRSVFWNCPIGAKYQSKKAEENGSDRYLAVTIEAVTNAIQQELLEKQKNEVTDEVATPQNLIEIIEAGSFPGIDDYRSGWIPSTPVDWSEPVPSAYQLVKNLIYTPSLTMVYADPGAYKSMLLLDMMLAISSGQDFLAPARAGSLCEPFPTIQSGCIHVDYDTGKRETHNRAQALMKGRNISNYADVNLVSYPLADPRLNMTKRESIYWLAILCKEHNARVIVLDNLRLISGQADENNSEMASVLAGLRTVAEAMNVAVVIIHHTKKNTEGSKANRLRGSSAILAALDTAIYLEAMEGSGVVTAEVTKNRFGKARNFNAFFQSETEEETGDMITAKFIGMDLGLDTSTPAGIIQALFYAVDQSEVGEEFTYAEVKAWVDDRDDITIGVKNLRGLLGAMVEINVFDQTEMGRMKIYSFADGWEPRLDRYAK